MDFIVATRPPLDPTARPPLLILLHGLGADETDLLGLAESLDPRIYVVSLRAPYPTGYGGFAWFRVEIHADGSRFLDEVQAVESRDALVQAIPRLATELRVSPSRVILGGFSQGAMIAAGIALSEPDLIDAAWIMSGRYLPGLDSGLPLATPRPVLQQHGIHDPVVSVEDGRRLAAMLRQRGHHLQYTEYPMAHQISAESLHQAAGWLKAISL